MSDQFLPVCEPTLVGNEQAYVLDALKTGWISSAGKYVTEFEKQFSQYCGVNYGVGVCNGTVALHLALVALGVGPGDEVIIPDFTMIATAFAVCYTGAKPVFVDADPETWNMDVRLIEEKITPRTKVILPVHIMGLLCDMPAINRIAKKHNLAVLEDAAEAHGAEYCGQKAGSFGDIAAFSFFANKNLTTGEGGMVVTDSAELFDRCRYHKNLCFPLSGGREYVHNDIGFNYRLSNLHAAIGLAQTEKADELRQMRRRNHSMYVERLSGVPGIRFQKDDDPDYLHVHWMNAILVDEAEYGMDRDSLMEHLRRNGIDSRKLFTGMHRQKALLDYGCEADGNYPVSERLAAEGLYLPSSSHLSVGQIERVCDVILKGSAL
jgi:perosamine synthetase